MVVADHFQVSFIKEKNYENFQLIHLHSHAYYEFPVGSENKTKQKQMEGGRFKWTLLRVGDADQW